MPEYLSNKKRKQSIGINSYSEYTDTTKIIGNVLVGFGSVGVGTTVPTQDVDVNTIRVRDTLFDYTNSGGEFGYYLVKDTGGIKWVAVPPIDSNAIFIAENNNILGVSSFTGLNIISDELIGVAPNPINPNFADITIVPRWLKSGETGIYTTKNVGIGTTIPTTDFQVGFGTTGVTIDGSVGVVSALGYYGNYAFIDQITVNDQLNVVGLGSTLVAAFLASAGGITTTGGDLYVGGSLFADKLDIINLKVVNIEATGITTLNVGIVSTFRVTGVSTLGVTSISQLNVSGITTLGITSTKDLFVDENLYVVGIATATRFSTGATGSAINITSNTISGPAEIIIDPAGVGDDSGAVRIKGDLFVDGEEFIVNSTTIELADFNVGIASTVGTNLLLDGAGIGIGSTNIRKTLTYDFSSDALKSSENFDLEPGKVYKINETEVLSSTQLTVANINATGVSTLGFATIGQLYVSGVSTFVGVGTFIEDLYVGRNLYVADDIFFDELTARNANITGITTLNVGIVSTFRVTGVSTLGVTSISQLYVSGVSTFVGVGTFINDLYVGEVLYADVVTGLTSTTDLLVGGDLTVTGITTLGVTTTTNLTSQQLYVSGVSTFVGVGTFSGDLYVSDILYADVVTGLTSTTDLLVDGDLKVTGVSTFVGFSTFNNSVIIQDNLLVSGITTLAENGGITTTGGDLYVGGILYADTVSFDSIQVENINATGITTLNVGIVSSLTVTGLSTLGVTSTKDLLVDGNLEVTGVSTFVGFSTFNNSVVIEDNLLVSGLSTFVGVGTFSGDLYVGGDLYVVDDIVFDEFTARNANVTGIGTIETLDTTTGTIDYLTGTNISYSGIGTIETLDVTTGTIDYLTGTNLSYSGIGTIETLDVTTGTIDYLTGTNLSYSGISTLGVTSTTDLTSQQLNVSGITTLGITTISELYVSGVSTFVGVGTFIGDLYVGGDLYVTDDIVFDEFTARNANITGIGTIETLDTTTGTIDYLTGTNLSYSGIGTIETLDVTTGTIDYLTNTNLDTSGIGTIETLDTTIGTIDYLTGTNLSYSGISTLGVTSTTNLTTQQLNVSGISTLESIIGTSLSISGISTLGVTSTTNLTSQQLNVSGITTLGVTTISQLYVSGVSTFSDRITGIISTATKLETPRTFEITGDVVASPIFFDGTGNVSLAATIQPNSVGLGTDTFGDYVKDITGTANQIIVTAGTGEGSSPILSIPNQFTAPQDVTVTRDLEVIRNLNVNGNITIGGTAATLFTQTFKVADADIILGVRTDGNGNDISTDNTANHGGIAIASTDGTPLVTLTNPGIGETLPATYKKFMWFKAGSFAGLGTDAWLSNYAIGIGSTQFPTGTRLAAGSVQFTENDLAVVRNINASGIITATEFKGTLTGYASSAGIATNLNGGVTGNVVYQYNTGITSFVPNGVDTQVLLFNGSTSTPYWGYVGSAGGTVGYADRAGIATYADNAGIATNLKDGVSGNVPYQLSPGITTFVDNSSAINGQVLLWNGATPYWGNVDAGSIVGIATYADRAGIATYADYAGISTNVIGGIASVSQLNVTGITTLGITSISQLNVSGITTLSSIVGTSLSISGISTIANFIMTPVGTGATVGGIGVTYYGDGSGLTDVVSTSGYATLAGIATYADNAGIATNVIGGIASVTSLNVTGISTLGTVEISSGIITATTGIVTYYGDGSGLTNINLSSVVGVVTYADRAGIATYADYAGISTNVIGGIASVTSLNVTGITTLASIVGTSLSITGISTIANFILSPVGAGATVGGIGVTYYGDGSQLTDVVSTSGYADNAGIATNLNGGDTGNIPYQSSPGITTFVSNPAETNKVLLWNGSVPVWGDVNTGSLVGVVTYADRAGIATNVIGGIASVTSLDVSGITTLGTVEISSGIITATTGVVTYYGDGFNLTNVVSASGYADTSGIATNVIGGIASVTSLNVTGITTLASIVGTSLSITGISTIANFIITNVGTGATVGGVGVLTYYGDGSQLTGLIAGVSISTDTTDQSQLIPYVTGTGSTTGFGVTTSFTYNPFSGNLGIGTTTPTSKLTVIGDVLVSGILTAHRLYGDDIVGTSLSIAGISTLGTVEISSGIITATTGIVTYYGDGSKLTDVVSTSGYADYAGIATNVIGGIASVTSLDVSGISTLGTVEISSGIITATTGIVTYYGDGSGLTNINLSAIVGVVTYVDKAGIATYADYAGIATNVIGGIASVTSLDVSGISTLGTVEISSGIITATTGIVTYYGDGSNLTNVVSTSGYADNAGIATNVIGGIASVTSLDVSGITTLGITTISELYVSGVSTFVGIGTFIGDLYVGGDLYVTDDLVFDEFTARNANITGITSLNVGIVSSLTVSGITTLGVTSTTDLTTQQLNVSGILTATFGGDVNVGTGITMYASTGIISATAFYGDGFNLTDIIASKIAGITVLDENTLVGTAFQFSQLNFVGSYVTATGDGSTASITFTTPESVIGGVASVTSLNVTGISTLGITSTTDLTTQQLNVSGITTLGITSTTDLTTQQLNVTGVTTLTSIVGTSLSISGISTLGTVEISSGIITATAGIVTYYGDGSNLTGVSAFSVQQQDITTSPVYPTFANGVGVSSLGIAVTQVAYIPASGNLGIGTTTPTSKLTVIGDVLVSGILTAENIVGTSLSISDISTLGVTSTTDLTTQQLNVTGITTLGITSTTNLTSQQLNVSGILTASHIVGTSLSISGISTFTNGPILVGAATSTGTTAQPLQVTGGAYVSGNLGIGTTTPTSKLTVQGDVSIASTLGIGTVIDIVPYDTLNSGTLSWEGSAGQLFSITNNLTTGSIYSVNDVSGIPSIDVDANGTIQLGPYGGNVGLGTTNPTAKLHVVGDVRVSGASTFGGIVELDGSLRDFYNNVGVAGSVLISTGAGVSWSPSAAVSIANTTTSDIHYVGFGVTSTGTLTTLNVNTDRLQFVPSSGTLSATVFTSLSDRTQKEDIRPIENAIGIVNQLTGVRYNWKNNTNKPSIGLIAQDVEEVIPEVVVEMADGLKSVSYGNIVAVLIEAIKEQQVRIEELEDRLNA